jgi:hypothetical protein
VSECSQAVGTGSIMYKCRVTPAGHDGPCAAPELGRTLIERQAWIAQQSTATGTQTPSSVIEMAERIEREVAPVAPAPVATMAVESPSPEAPTGAVQLGSFSDFEMSARDLMTREELTPALNNWLTGTAAQIALNHLWRQAQSAFDAGCTSITMSRQELEQFVPERLRPT